MISGMKYITKYSFLINSLICLLAIIASSLFKSTSLLAYTAFYECVGAELGLIIAYSTIYLICLIIERIKIWANNTPVIRKLFTRCTKKNVGLRKCQSPTPLQWSLASITQIIRTESPILFIRRRSKYNLAKCFWRRRKTPSWN